MLQRHWPMVIGGSLVVVVLMAAFVLTNGRVSRVKGPDTGPEAVGLTSVAPVAETPVQAAAALPAPTTRESGPSRPGVEGIQVHGRWTIEVREPDGRLVSRTEFENAVVPTGEAALAEFLARKKTPGWWQILLLGSPNMEPCLDAGTNAVCIVAESGDSTNTSNVFKNLAVGLTPGLMGARLSGTATVQRSGNVDRVRTRVHRCDNTIAPSSPCSSLAAIFTQTTLATPIAVLLNQQVAVTVDISFQ